MTTTDFTTTILVDKTPKQVFDAIKNPRAWWTGEFEGNTNKLHDEFTYRYKEFHFSKQRVTEMIPDKKIVWEVIDSQLNFIEDNNEWTGTRITFEISQLDNKTQLRFTHEGLVPEFECFDSCSTAWTQLIKQGLYSLITSGREKKVDLG